VPPDFHQVGWIFLAFLRIGHRFFRGVLSLEPADEAPLRSNPVVARRLSDSVRYTYHIAGALRRTVFPVFRVGDGLGSRIVFDPVPKLSASAVILPQNTRQDDQEGNQADGVRPWTALTRIPQEHDGCSIRRLDQKHDGEAQEKQVPSSIPKLEKVQGGNQGCSGDDS